MMESKKSQIVLKLIPFAFSIDDSYTYKKH